MAETRAKILLTMAQLIEKQGYHATGLTEIIKESGAPKGSVYYFFPGGKVQIGVEAIIEAGKIISGRLRAHLEGVSSPADAIHDFLMQMAGNVEASGFSAGSPLTTAAIETAITSAAINQACQDAIELILTAFQDKFLAGGYDEKQAGELALYVTTVVEGGIMMSRTYHRVEPLRLAAKHLKAYLTQKGS